MTYKTSEVNARLLLKEQDLEIPLKKNPTGNILSESYQIILNPASTPCMSQNYHKKQTRAQ